ncbi:vitamin K epoxide reductase family protein [Sphingobacterium deserti]|uniref:Vitamin k epoxide reductase n=1 Tax=Sphingobacterium deserti TaxID=1229276 RepID=A0A0B8SZM4_9SPHI|nr:vitamin K epoxide reductase family protein [Sphingobacterium deserti]KGE13337.1 vitamin k epoxide reductase [Sphingobacterium deserti]
MVNLLKQRYIDRESNVIQVCQEVLLYAKVKHTQLQLSNSLSSHLEPFSLLSVQDILDSYGIESAAVRLGDYQYNDFETPFICVLQREHWPHPALTVVKQAAEDQVSFWDPEHKRMERVSVRDFSKIDKEVVLLLDDGAKRDEADYATNRKTEKRQHNLKKAAFYGSGILLSLALLNILNTSFEATWLAAIFLFTSSIGLALSSLLIWHEVDAFHPFLKEVCGGFGKKSDCNAVLSSSGASFLGLSWSTWGFAYFACFFVSQLFFVFQPSGLYLLAYASIFVSPYIAYSLYFQARIIKQWCPLCLFVQATLLVNALASVYFLSESSLAYGSLNGFALLPLGFLFLGFLLLAHQAVPLLKDSKKSKDLERQWRRLRYNPDIFQSLLEKSSKITTPVDGLGVVIGNPEAKIEIVKVCNTYCGPCSKAHPELEAVLDQNPNVKLRIIFTGTGAADDIRTKPVAHLLAIQQTLGMEKVREALDDWYLAKEKNYEKFSTKYPMNGELELQGDKIDAMRDWCDLMKIRATPTIFINGSELPDGYQIAELKNIL